MPELPEFGYICPNQFSDEEFQHPALDEMLTAAEATAAAQEIADQLNQPVKVEYQHQFWTGHGFEAPHRSQIFNPGQWPSPLTIESVAAWLWSNMHMPVNGHAILRGLQHQSVKGS